MRLPLKCDIMRWAREHSIKIEYNAILSKTAFTTSHGYVQLVHGSLFLYSSTYPASKLNQWECCNSVLMPLDVFYDRVLRWVERGTI